MSDRGAVPESWVRWRLWEGGLRGVEIFLTPCLSSDIQTNNVLDLLATPCIARDKYERITIVCWWHHSVVPRRVLFTQLVPGQYHRSFPERPICVFPTDVFLWAWGIVWHFRIRVLPLGDPGKSDAWNLSFWVQRRIYTHLRDCIPGAWTARGYRPSNESLGASDHTSLDRGLSRVLGDTSAGGFEHCNKDSQSSPRHVARCQRSWRVLRAYPGQSTQFGCPVLAIFARGGAAFRYPT